MTNQPEWKLVANLGDVNPIDYGGYFIYEDTTGVYPPEAEVLLEPNDDEEEKWIVYRFSLDRCKKFVLDDLVYLIPYEWDSSWRYSAHVYDEWFNNSIEDIANFVGYDVDDLRYLFCSESIIDRALAYRAVGDYWGYDNLDSYPLFLNRKEVEERYAGQSTSI